jgi:hypothetical protein
MLPVLLLVLTTSFAIAGCGAGNRGSAGMPYTVLGALKKLKPKPPYPPGNVNGGYQALDAALLLNLSAAETGAPGGGISEYAMGVGALWTGSYTVKGDTITATVHRKASKKVVTCTFKTLGNDGLRETDSGSNGRLWYRFIRGDED